MNCFENVPKSAKDVKEATNSFISIMATNIFTKFAIYEESGLWEWRLNQLIMIINDLQEILMLKLSSGDVWTGIGKKSEI